MKTYNRFIILLSIITVIHIQNVNLYANNDIFEIITPKTTNSSSSSGGNSLFNLENESTKSESRDWENNPFDKSEDIIMPDTMMMDLEVIEEGDPTAYKLKAIWKRNNTYKALISGYIVKENETINTIKILKITNNSITIEINEEEEEHILGSTFYED